MSRHSVQSAPSFVGIAIDGRGTHVDTQRHVPVTSVEIELIGIELDGDKCDVGVVHRLESLFAWMTYIAK